MLKRIVNKIRVKLAGIDGETLVETLVSTLIMALVMLMLSTAIVSAAKVNASAKTVEKSFNEAASSDSEAPVQDANNLTVTIKSVDGENTVTTGTFSNENGIKAYTQNGYYCYEPVSSNQE